MADQSELTSVLLRILHKGVLRIRTEGWRGQADRCAIEADHLHNLPSLILKPNAQELSYYLDVTRTDFVNHGLHTEEFESDWNRLRSIISEMRRPN